MFTSKNKGNVVPVHAIKAYWVKVQLHTFLTSALDGGKGQLHITAAFIPKQIEKYGIPS